MTDELFEVFEELTEDVQNSFRSLNYWKLCLIALDSECNESAAADKKNVQIKIDAAKLEIQCLLKLIKLLE
jgi:hypothetical protein